MDRKEGLDRQSLADQWARGEKKELALEPGIPFANSLEVKVLDFPKGSQEGSTRQRCKVTLDYGRADVDQLKVRGVDSLQDALEYYREYLYKMVKVNLSADWTAVRGLEETMALVKDRISRFY